MNAEIKKNETDYILTSFVIDEETYQCPCGSTIGWDEDHDMFATLSSWRFCPTCGQNNVQYITEEQALLHIIHWLASVDLDRFKIEKGFNYSSLEWEYIQKRGDNKVLYRNFDDFTKLIDKALKIDKKQYEAIFTRKVLK